MISQAPDLVGDFRPDFGEELVVAGIDRARAHHVVPYENAQLVAGVVEHILLVLPAAPEANHVHVGGGCAGEKVAVAFWRLGIFVGGARNPVGAFHEDAAAIDAEYERKLFFAVCADGSFIEDFKFPQTDFLYDLLAIYIEFASVELLLPFSVGPPQRRIFDFECLFLF